MNPEEWQIKQAKMQQFLDERNAGDAPCRVDLTKCKIYWVDDLGLSLAVADCRVLLSYALSNNSVLLAWANSSLSEESSIEPIEGVDDLYPDSEPFKAWELAVRVATEVKADAIYRVPSPQSWVFLGIWNLRPGGAEQFTSGSPKNHVLQVLHSLLTHPDPSERQVLLDNYAESFLQMASHPYKMTEFEERLRDTARSLRNLLVYEEQEKQDKGLTELREAWVKVEDKG